MAYKRGDLEYAVVKHLEIRFGFSVVLSTVLDTLSGAIVFRETIQNDINTMYGIRDFSPLCNCGKWATVKDIVDELEEKLTKAGYIVFKDVRDY